MHCQQGSLPLLAVHSFWETYGAQVIVKKLCLHWWMCTSSTQSANSLFTVVLFNSNVGSSTWLQMKVDNVPRTVVLREITVISKTAWLNRDYIMWMRFFFFLQKHLGVKYGFPSLNLYIGQHRPICGWFGLVISFDFTGAKCEPQHSVWLRQ